MKLIIIFHILLISFSIQAQKNYHANNHVGYKTTEKNGKYIVDYTFKDQNNKICKVKYSLDRTTTKNDINKFGIPRSMLAPYRATKSIILKRKKDIRDGLFKQQGNILKPDKNAMVNFYSNYTKVIADWMISYLKKQNIDTRLDRIRLAMCFVQDIPYAVPNDRDPNWYFGGVMSTPEIIISGYGDCDSKAILFVGILCHLINPDNIRFAGEKGHVYTVIKNNNTNLIKDGKTSYFRLKEGNFVIAETAGPGRTKFGEKGNRKYHSATLEKIYFNK